MVPAKIGDELRRRRLLLRLKQADIAANLGTTRAYISAVENGVAWDPDAAKLTKWARALGWEDDAILRRLGRPDKPEPGLPDELRDLIASAVSAAVDAKLDELATRLERGAASSRSGRKSPAAGGASRDRGVRGAEPAR